MKKILTLCLVGMTILLGHIYAQQAGLKLIAEGLTSPLVIADPGDRTNRLFIADEIGLIRIVDSTGKLLPEPFLDIRNKMIKLKGGGEERGLLGLAFHPDYTNNGRFFIHYSAPSGDTAYDHVEVISGFHVSAADPNRADTAETVLLRINHPQLNHNGGQLAFGPKDGYLYISMGDGGGPNDSYPGHVSDWYTVNTGGNAQNIEANLLGKMLRIDVDSGATYRIPPDNPFVNKIGLDEIYAYGLRNPYKFSFDMGGTNQLFVGDAGEQLYEEVSIVEKGGNYGWNVKEGTHCFNTDSPKVPRPSCPDTDGYGQKITDPVIEFTNSKIDSINGQGVTIIGGYVYRGQAIPELYGKYIFGSWAYRTSYPSGRILFSTPDSTSSGLWPIERLSITDSINTTPGQPGQLKHFLIGFGQDRNGEMYILTTDSVGPTGTSGKVFMFTSPGGATGADKISLVPKQFKLSQAYPNPFNPTTTISFDLPAQVQVELKVFDMMGREVKTLINGILGAGSHRVQMDGSDLTSGVYFYRIKAGNFVRTMKMVMVK